MQKIKSSPDFRLCVSVLILLFAAGAAAQTAVTPNAAIPAQSVKPSVQDTQSPAQNVAPDSMVDKRTLKIGGGDLLEVKVYGVPELTDSVRVSARGCMWHEVGQPRWPVARNGVLCHAEHTHRPATSEGVAGASER